MHMQKRTELKIAPPFSSAADCTSSANRYVRTQISPTPPQDTPFPGLNLKVGKLNYSQGKMDPNLGKMFGKWAKRF